MTTDAQKAVARSPRKTVGAGRPRREGLDQAILDAALHELARAGYGRMTLAAVARRAGTTKPSIYARFPSKAALATGALESLRRRTPRHRSGDVRADLIEELSLLRNGALRANGMTLVGAVLVEERENPEFIRQFRKHVVEPRRANLRAILVAGRESGQLDEDADIELAITMMIGSLYAAYMAGVRTRRDWAERVVEAWLRANGTSTSTPQEV
jgi:AcrR family transcriptional regulator